MPRNIASLLFLTLSLLGLILIAALVNLSPKRQDNISWRKPIVGTVFGIVCILGILAGIFPSKCSSMFHFRKAEFDQEWEGLPEKTPVFRGHHPDCGSFSAHIIRVGHMTFCAGCMGLIFGAVLSLFGVTLYFFINIFFELNYFLVFWIGFVGVFCGLLQYHLFNWGESFVHLAVNSYFVFGVFLFLVGVDRTIQNTLVDFYLVVLSLFWLYTRILLSQLDHRKICNSCHVKECEFYR